MSARSVNLALVLDDLTSGRHNRDLELAGKLNVRLFQAYRELKNMPEECELRRALHRAQRFRHGLLTELGREATIAFFVTLFCIGGVLL